MKAHYDGENSSMSVKKVFFEFGYKHLKLFTKRILIKYFLRDFNFGSIMLIIGIICSILVIAGGVPLWVNNASHEVVTPVGTIIKYLLLTLFGIEGIVGWLFFDMFSQPNNAIADLLSKYDDV